MQLSTSVFFVFLLKGHATNFPHVDQFTEEHYKPLALWYRGKNIMTCLYLFKPITIVMGTAKQHRGGVLVHNSC